MKREDIIIIDDKHQSRFEELLSLVTTMADSLDNTLYAHLTKKERSTITEPVRNSLTTPKYNRNDLCHCGSGKKYKHCCFNKDDNLERS